MNASARPTILITGATGLIGGQVARALLAKGTSFVAASRNPDRLDDLVRAGEGRVEARTLDLEDPATYGAFEGIDTLFLVGPQGPGFGARVAATLEAARTAGVRHVVRYSALGADPDASFPLAREHGIAERAVEASGLSWTILQPTFYQDNLFTYQSDAIRSTNAFYGASLEGKVAYVASSDIAAVATAIVLHPADHAGRRYVLTGPEALSDVELAARLSRAAGKTIRYVDIGDEGVASNLRDAGTPPFMVESMVGLEQVKRKGWAAEVSPAVEAILGRPAAPVDALFAARASSLA